MFETTLEAQSLDRGERRLGTLSAAVLAHVGAGLAIVAATALIVPPVHPPDPPRGILVILPPSIPLGDPRPLPPPKPPKGTDHAGASMPVTLPRVDPVTPRATPDALPDAPPSDSDAVDQVGNGLRGDPDGADGGVPGGTGDGSTGDDTGLDVSSPRVLTGEMERPVLLSKVEPIYPNTARIARMTGRVVVEAVIGLDGGVESAEVTSSTSSLFDQAALDAVRHWRYKPALMHGRPVRVYFKVAVEFVIR